MNKIKAFKNAREFQQLFGIQEHGNGVKSRRNKILLQFYKSKQIWDYCRSKNGTCDYFFSIRSMAELKEIITSEIKDELNCQAMRSSQRFYQIILMGNVFWSSVYSTDENNGIPSNGDVGFVRYVTHEENRNKKVYKMRAGKFYKRVLLESELGRSLPVQVLNWLCEQFAESWSSYVTRTLPHFTLHVDDDFRRIYSYGYLRDNVCGCTHDFGSCMMGDDQWQFYKQCVKAKAAYLTNNDGGVIARCVIFTDVKDEDGNSWRLAERQYSEEGRDLYKRCLVDALIEGGYIDGYKQVGVDCHSTTSYVDTKGNSLMDKEFSIDCNLDFSSDADDAWEVSDNRILSYQDSFKFYDFKLRKSYNTEPYDMRNIAMLDTTSCYLEGYWDEYHSDWCVSLLWVYVKGRELRCAYGMTDDFTEYNGYLIHNDDFIKCPVCGNKMPNPEYYSSMGFMRYAYDGETRHYVCCRSCARELEKEFAKKMFFDSLKGQHVKRTDENQPLQILHVFFGDTAETVTISSSDLPHYIENGTITIVKSAGDLKIPMYSKGMPSPQKRHDEYMKCIPVSMARVVEEIIRENKKNGVHSLYSVNVENFAF